MSWNKFRNRLSNKMKKGPRSSEEFGKLLASCYDGAMKSVTSGENASRNRLIKGNKKLLEQHIIRSLNAQSKSKNPLNIINLIAKGFPLYWTGATLSVEKLPTIPAPGSIFNINITSHNVSNPGIATPIIIPLGKSQSSEQFINNLIKAAQQHLKTVSGTIQTISAYSPGPPPTGWVPGPGIIIWTGYTVVE